MAPIFQVSNFYGMCYVVSVCVCVCFLLSYYTFLYGMFELSILVCANDSVSCVCVFICLYLCINITFDPKSFGYQFLATLDERGQGIPKDGDKGSAK